MSVLSRHLSPLAATVPVAVFVAALASAGLAFAQNPQVYESPAPKTGGNFGYAVAAAGDLNGNGLDDIVVAAPVENGDGPFAGNAGRLYVYDGSGATLFDIGVPPFLGQRYGTSLDAGHDFDGDGIGDILAGSLSEHALLFSGATGDTIHYFSHPDGLFGTQYGVQVAFAGDVNDDGYADVLVAAIDDDVDGFTRAGKVYLYAGPDATLLASLESPLPEDGQFGISLDGAHDVDDDGLDDFIIGAFLDPVNGLSDAGRAYVFSGATLDTLFTLTAPTPLQSAQFAKSVAGIGDITGDDHADLLVGAWQDMAPGLVKSGRAYAYSGADGSLLHDLQSPSADPNGLFGSDVAGLGDYDGDGTNDLAVSAHTEDEAGVNGSGRVHVFSGATGLPLDTLVSPNLENFGRFGVACASAGDANGDGRADVIVGAGLEADAGLNDSGRAYLFSAPGPTAVAPERRLGFEMLAAAPNPFNPRTSIRFSLEAAAELTLSIFDASGRRVETLHRGPMAAGEHRVVWQAEGRASGVYFCQLRVGANSASQSLVLVK